MIENEEHLKRILKVLDDECILKDIILIGSWSLLFYSKVFNNFEPLLRTIDIDFYVPDAKKVREKTGIIKCLKELNYDVIHDTLTNKSKFISPDGFELEFLTKLNRNRVSCIKVGNTGIYAEALSYLDIFSANFIEVNYDDLTLKVASPSSYVLQKLLINSQRKIKSEKDLESVRYVLDFIKISKKSMNELNEMFKSLPKSWQSKITKTCNINNIKLLTDKLSAFLFSVNTKQSRHKYFYI